MAIVLDGTTGILNLDVIVVSGTVDGRDVAADGTANTGSGGGGGGQAAGAYAYGYAGGSGIVIIRYLTV